MEKRENLFLSSLYSIIGFFIKKFLGFIYNVIIARILDKELFGVFSFVMNITTNVHTISNVGLSATQKYLFTKYETNKNIISTLFFIKLIFLTIGSLVVLFFSYTFIRQYLNYIILGIVYYIIFSFIYFFIDIFIAQKNFKKANFFEIIFIFFRTTFSLILALIGYSIYGVFLGLILGSLPILIYFLIFFTPRIKNIKKDYFLEVLNFGKYTGISDISWIVYGTIDSVILGILLNPVFVGYYNIASKFISVGISIFTTIITTFFPYFITWIQEKKFDKVKKTYEIYIKYSFFFIIPLFLIFLIKSEAIVKIIYGSQYSDASIVLSILSFLVIFSPLITLYQNILYSLNRLKEVTYISVTTTILNIFLDLLFVNIFGYIGVAISTVILFAIMAFYYYYLLKKEYDLKISLETMWLIFISGVIYGLLLIIFRPFPFPIDLIIPTLAYLVYIHFFVFNLFDLVNKILEKIRF